MADETDKVEEVDKVEVDAKVDTDTEEVKTDEVEQKVDSTDVSDLQNEISKWKALSRKNEASFKEAEVELKKLREESQKVDALTADNLKLKKDLNESIKLSLLLKEGIPENFVKYISGDNADDIAKSISSLKEDINISKTNSLKPFDFQGVNKTNSQTAGELARERILKKNKG